MTRRAQPAELTESAGAAERDAQAWSFEPRPHPLVPVQVCSRRRSRCRCDAREGGDEAGKPRGVDLRDVRMRGDESGEPLEDGVPDQACLKRPRRNMSIGWLVCPSQTRSARTSPMTEANLKPCPEHGLARIMLGWRG